ELREQGVKMKLSPVKGIIEGKKIVMIDDSIVRGTTSRRIVRLLKEAGAKEVHVRISSPRIENPCYYGIDMSTRTEINATNYETKKFHVRISPPRIENSCYYGIDMSTRQELIAANYDTEKMCELIEADSLAFLSPTGMERALIREKSINQGLCKACFTGDYPVL